MKTIAVVVALIIVLGTVAGLSTSHETTTQKIERVCGADNDCKLREEIRVIAASDRRVQDQQDQEVGQ